MSNNCSVLSDLIESICKNVCLTWISAVACYTAPYWKCASSSIKTNIQSSGDQFVQFKPVFGCKSVLQWVCLHTVQVLGNTLAAHKHAAHHPTETHNIKCIFLNQNRRLLNRRVIMAGSLLFNLHMKLCTFVGSSNANLMGVCPLADARWLPLKVRVMRDTNYPHNSVIVLWTTSTNKWSVFEVCDSAVRRVLLYV